MDSLHRELDRMASFLRYPAQLRAGLEEGVFLHPSLQLVILGTGASPTRIGHGMISDDIPSLRARAIDDFRRYFCLPVCTFRRRTKTKVKAQGIGNCTALGQSPIPEEVRTLSW